MDAQLKCLFLLLAGTVLSTASTEAELKRCPTNEVYKCVGCEHICNGPWAACEEDCSERRCECDASKGFYRAHEGGPCIKREDCPADTNPTRCGANAEFKECRGCDHVCGAPASFCAKKCEEAGCVCKSGYSLTHPFGSCIPTSQCTPLGDRHCPQNEVWRECLIGCERACNGPEPMCLNTCKQPIMSGCECDPEAGFSRIGQGGMCVKNSECPKP